MLKRKSQNNLPRWEREIIRRILGGEKREEGYTRRTNEKTTLVGTYGTNLK